MVIGNHNLEAVLHDTFVSGHGCRLVRLSLRGAGRPTSGAKKRACPMGRPFPIGSPALSPTGERAFAG